VAWRRPNRREGRSSTRVRRRAPRRSRDRGQLDVVSRSPTGSDRSGRGGADGTAMDEWRPNDPSRVQSAGAAGTFVWMCSPTPPPQWHESGAAPLIGTSEVGGGEGAIPAPRLGGRDPPSRGPAPRALQPARDRRVHPRRCTWRTRSRLPGTPRRVAYHRRTSTCFGDATGPPRIRWRPRLPFRATGARAKRCGSSPRLVASGRNRARIMRGGKEAAGRKDERRPSPTA